MCRCVVHRTCLRGSGGAWLGGVEAGPWWVSTTPSLSAPATPDGESKGQGRDSGGRKTGRGGPSPGRGRGLGAPACPLLLQDRQRVASQPSTPKDTRSLAKYLVYFQRPRQQRGSPFHSSHTPAPASSSVKPSWTCPTRARAPVGPPCLDVPRSEDKALSPDSRSSAPGLPGRKEHTRLH